VFACLLLLGGLITTVVGVAHLSGHMDARIPENGYHLIGLGSLLLLPGSYVCFVAFASWRGWRGYDYSLIPGY
jgi:Transmembrane proteins 230/134